MSTERNKATFRAIMELVINGGDLAVADELFSPDYIEHSVLPHGFPPDIAGFKAFLTLIRRVFPDLQCDVELILAEGDLVTCMVNGCGTHTGEFLGIAPTGKRITWMEMHIGYFVSDKLLEHWCLTDRLSILQQLSVDSSVDPHAFLDR